MKMLPALGLAAIVCTPALAEPEIYVVDGKHTYPRFQYSHFGYSTQIGRFDKTGGKITVDRVARTGTVDITIDATSVDSGNAQFNEHLKGEEFFDVQHFPVITFKSKTMRFEGDRLAAVDGILTVKGISKPVTLTVTSSKCMLHPLVKKEACGANATTKINRTEFNAGKYAPFVGDEVTLDIAVEAIKEEG